MPDGASLKAGACLLVLALISVALIIPGYMTAAEATPNGVLPNWYEIAMCSNGSDALAVSDADDGESETQPEADAAEAATRSFWLKYARVPVEGEMVGTACPVVASTGPYDFNLEAGDGYRTAASYRPILLVPAGSYALVSISISDSEGNTLRAKSRHNPTHDGRHTPHAAHGRPTGPPAPASAGAPPAQRALHMPATCGGGGGSSSNSQMSLTKEGI